MPDINYSSISGKAPIILVERGLCSISTKVRNVEQAHGQLAILLNYYTTDPRDINLENKNPFININVPGMLVSPLDGGIIKEYYDERIAENPLAEVIIEIKIEMKKVEADGKETIDLYFTSLEEKMYVFLKTFYKYYQEISNIIFYNSYK